MSDTESVHAAAERETLAWFLDFLRASVVRKCDGLDEDALRWSPVPSGTSLLGLVGHLTDVETWWFRHVFSGEKLFEPGDGSTEAAWQVEGMSPGEVVAAYEEACARSREVVAAAPSLDAVAAQGRGESLRWILVHMIEETGRHAGHADIVRELRDGATGE